MMELRFRRGMNVAISELVRPSSHMLRSLSSSCSDHADMPPANFAVGEYEATGALILGRYETCVVILTLAPPL